MKLEECVLPEISWAKVTVNYRAAWSTSPRTRRDQLRTGPCIPCPEAPLLPQGVEGSCAQWALTSDLTAECPTEGACTISRWPG